MSAIKGIDIDLTKGKSSIKEDMRVYSPGELLRAANRKESHPVINFIRTIYTEDALQIIEKDLVQTANAVNEIFVYSLKSVGKFEIRRDPGSKQKYEKPVVSTISPYRNEIRIKMHSEMETLTRSYDIYRAWAEERESDYEVLYEDPKKVRFFTPCPESVMLFDLIVLFDHCCAALDAAHISGSISKQEAAQEKSVIRSSLKNLMSYISDIGFAVRKARMNKLKELKEKKLIAQRPSQASSKADGKQTRSKKRKTNKKRAEPADMTKRSKTPKRKPVKSEHS